MSDVSQFPGPTSGEWPGDTVPLVSVCVITYQHARFIARALDGILMQRTSFPVEIIVGEDGSSDGTREICLDYARRHPRIRVLLRKRTEVGLVDGMPAGGTNLIETTRLARGEFLALCEGDDYWTDAEKLEHQVEYLRANRECAGCFHDSILVDGDGNTLLKSYFQSEQDKFSQEDVLKTLHSREPTCSLMFRSSAFGEPLPEWFLRRPCDLYLDILLTNQGPLGFLRRNMGAYRKHPGGMWSGQREANQLIELIIRYKLLLADDFFLANYRDLLLREIGGFQAALFTHADFVGELSRVEKIVVEQTTALASSQQHQTSAQQDIDRLSQQVVELAATTKEQSDYVAVLETERNRVTVDLAEAQRNAKRFQREAQAHLSSLRKQLEELAGTCQTQAGYITVLETERNRLTVELAETQHSAKSAQGQSEMHLATLRKQLEELSRDRKTQAGDIATLEAERNRLTSGLAEARRDAKRIKKESVANLRVARIEIENLAATCKEQTSYIAILEAEKNRLTSEFRAAQVQAKSMRDESETLLGNARTQAEHLTAQVNHYVSVIEEQLSYIRILETERDRTNAVQK